MKQIILGIMLGAITAFGQSTASTQAASTFALTVAGSPVPITGPYGFGFLNLSATQQAFLTWNILTPGVTIPANATTAASGGSVYTLAVTGRNVASSMTIGTNTPCGVLSVEDSTGTEFYLTACLQGGATTAGCTLPFSDNFHGALGSAYTVAPPGSVSTVSNTATVAAYSAGQQIAAPVGCSGWTNSQYAQVTGIQGNVSSRFGAAVNVADSSDYYYIECTINGGCNANSFIAGKANYLGTFSTIPAAGSTVCVELDAGKTLKLKIAGKYALSSIAASGVSGTGGGAVYFGSQASPAASITGFQTGNGVCP